MRVLYLPTDGPPEVRTIAPDLDAMNALVDGGIACIRLDGGRCLDVWFDEEFLYNKTVLNPYAHRLPGLRRFGAFLGPMFVAGIREEDGETVSLTDQDVAWLQEQLATPPDAGEVDEGALLLLEKSLQTIGPEVAASCFGVAEIGGRDLDTCAALVMGEAGHAALRNCDWPMAQKSAEVMMAGPGGIRHFAGQAAGLLFLVHVIAGEEEAIRLSIAFNNRKRLTNTVTVILAHPTGCRLVGLRKRTHGLVCLPGGEA